MSEIQIYLLEFEKNKPEAQRIAYQTATKLENRQLKLIDLITSLEEYINNKEDDTIRARSVSYLADVLGNVPQKVFSGQERRLLCDFILGRIEGDVEGIGASSRALIALEKLGKWDRELTQKVTQTYFSHAYPLRQFKLQTERFAIVQLFDVLIAKYRDAIKQLHESDQAFMTTFITFFEGEKDPRNLMIIFSILQVPMTEWDIRNNAKDLFEAVFNYFPITFKPPPDDPYGITAQDLKERLRGCIAANADFAPHSIPALLDKLDSTAMNTKRDVLQTMQACIVNYGPHTINLYSVTLWDALKFEILNIQEEDLAEESLKTLGLIALTLSGEEGPLNAYLRPIIKECNEHLEDAPTKQSSAAGRILHAITSSASPAAEKIVKGVVPPLFTLHHASENIVKRRGLLEVFNQIIKAYAESSRDHAGAPDIEALQSSIQEALEAMLRALLNAPKSEVSFRLAALEGLGTCVAIPKLLAEKDIHRVLDAVTDVLLQEKVEGHGDIKPAAIKALTEMAKTAPAEVRERAIPRFMAELPDSPGNGADWEPVLEAFAQLSLEQQVFDTVALRLKNKLHAARLQHASGEYQHSLLLALLYAFTYGSPMLEDGFVRKSYFTDFVSPLMTSVRDTSSDSSSLEVIGRLCNAVLRPQGMHFQATVYNENLSWMSPSANAEMTSSRIIQLAPFSLYYYAALQSEVVEPADIASLLRLLAQSTLETSDQKNQNEKAMQLISLLINKFIKPAAMEQTLESANIEVASLLQKKDNPHAIAIAFAVVKALVVQGKSGKLTSKYIDLLVGLLQEDRDNNISRRFATLLAPDEILTKENHCIVSGLYKQKIFSSTVPVLVENIRSSTDPASKPAKLIALSGVVRWLQYSVLEGSLADLIPPLLQTLDLTDPADQAVKTSTLTIFEAALLHNPDVIAEHAASLVSRLLKCTTANASESLPGLSSAAPTAAVTSPVSSEAAPAENINKTINAAPVRAKALQCLALMPQRLRRETVLPFRRRVIQRLLACLDDARRNVRGEAVKCRRAWLGLEEDEE